MTELAITEAVWRELTNTILESPLERCAVILAQQCLRPSGEMRLLANKIVWPAIKDYTSADEFHAELTPGFVLFVANLSRTTQSSLVFVHSHVDRIPPKFSRTDDAGEQHLSRFLAGRGSKLHAALVVSSGGTRARILGSSEEMRVITVGKSLKIVSGGPTAGDPDEVVFDRQLRALGADAQRAIGRLRIGVVGLGGTGSLVSLQLAHLGVRDFILLDPDVIEPSNLNRVAGANVGDVGQAKVRVAQRYIEGVSPFASILAIQGDVMWARWGRELLRADLIFCCTDSHGSRAVLEQICYQYLLPMIDMGTVIDVTAGAISQIVGRVQMISPGLACLTCSGLLDPEAVRRDMMTAFERQSDPYFIGAQEPAPAVISLNSTIAALSVTMALAATTTLSVPARYLIYRALVSSLRAVASRPQVDCLICSPEGRTARGDSWPFPGRQD